GGWKALSRYDSGVGGEGVSSITLADGRFIKYAKAKPGDDQDSLIAIDPATGAQTTLFTPPAPYDRDGAIEDPWTGVAVGVSYLADFPVQKFFDPALEAVRAKAAAKFAAGYATLTTWDRARDAFVIHGEMGANPPAYYLYRPATDKLSMIGAEYPSLGPNDIGERLTMNFKARDGVAVPAYLTIPRGAARKNLPLVVLVHGGPAARDDFTFDWWSAFLASRGYGVLQPEYRGSAGYGAKWEEAGHKQWGRLMQDDVSDGVGAMIRAGIADPKRVCIVGASYGGYAALAGATLTPDLYKCAIAIAGVSDLAAMLDREIDRTGRDSATVDYWKVSIGDRVADRAAIKAASPIEHVDAVKAPILIMHGPDDTVVPIAQSRAMEKKLKDAGKAVRFVLLRGDDHWLSYAPTRTQMLEESEKFLAENLK
ncbi:MAG TPA: alpha/beta fold hydrolase, partial [Caulobacterales bacterium]|nr:alpha/beta fold hydrolase [Caulobacterales bacterium]